jgi:hypothetical protein
MDAGLRRGPYRSEGLSTTAGVGDTVPGANLAPEPFGCGQVDQWQKSLSSYTTSMHRVIGVTSFTCHFQMAGAIRLLLLVNASDWRWMSVREGRGGSTSLTGIITAFSCISMIEVLPHLLLSYKLRSIRRISRVALRGPLYPIHLHFRFRRRFPSRCIILSPPLSHAS